MKKNIVKKISKLKDDGWKILIETNGDNWYICVYGHYRRFDVFNKDFEIGFKEVLEKVYK